MHNKNLHRRNAVEETAAEFLENVRAVISHCLSPERTDYAPADFPLADLDQRGLEQLSQLLRKTD